MMIRAYVVGNFNQFSHDGGLVILSESRLMKNTSFISPFLKVPPHSSYNGVGPITSVLLEAARVNASSATARVFEVSRRLSHGMTSFMKDSRPFRDLALMIMAEVLLGVGMVRAQRRVYELSITRSSTFSYL